MGQISLFMSLLGLLDMFINVIPAATLVLLNVDHIEWASVPWIPLAGSALLGLGESESI